MPRPENKQDLLKAIDNERRKLEKTLENLTPQELIEPGIVGEWSVKDVLAHLSAWEQMCLGWYHTGIRGEMPALPAPGFKWNQIAQLNHQIYEEHKDQPLEEVLDYFQDSSREILELIQYLSDQKLFSPGQFAWTKKNTLGTYFVSNTSSHYAWANKEIRKGWKVKKESE